MTESPNWLRRGNHRAREGFLLKFTTGDSSQWRTSRHTPKVGCLEFLTSERRSLNHNQATDGLVKSAGKCREHSLCGGAVPQFSPRGVRWSPGNQLCAPSGSELSLILRRMLSSGETHNSSFPGSIRLVHSDLVVRELGGVGIPRGRGVR